MPEPTRTRIRVAPPARRLGALALLALAACLGQGSTAPGSDECTAWCASTPPRVEDPPLALSHHGIVRGTVRDAAGAPVAGAEPDLAALAPDGAATFYEIDGRTLTQSDGAFRVRYTVGLGRRADLAIVEVLAWLPGRGRGEWLPVRTRLPTPRPVSEPADSVQVTLVAPP